MLPEDSAAQQQPGAAPKPSATNPRLVVVRVIAACVGVLLWGGVGWQVFVVVPRMARVFQEFQVRPPLLAQLIVHHSWWIVLALFVLTSLGVVAARSRLSWVVLLVVLPLFLNVVIGLSISSPYFQLLEGLSATKRNP
jgi:hypothetical protein